MFNLNPKITLLIGRLVLAGVIYAGTLAIATIVDAAEYGVIALIIFLAKSSPNFSFGINQGILYYLFGGKVEYLSTYLKSYFLIYVLTCVLYFFVYGYPAALLALVVMPIFLVEPYLKSKRNFFVILYPETILVAAFLLSALLAVFLGGAPSIWLTLAFSTLFSTLISQKLYRSHIGRLSGSLRGHPFSRKQFLDLVRQGLPAYSFNIMFFLFMLIDRTLVQKIYGNETVGSFLLAYQIALIAGFAVSTLNATSIVDLGEIRGQSRKFVLRYAYKRAFQMFVVNAIFLSFTLVALFIVDDLLFSDYAYLLHFTSAIGIGLLWYNIYCAVSPILFYLRKQAIPALLMLLANAISVMAHATSYHLNFGVLPVVLANSISLSLVMMGAIGYLFYQLQRDQDEPF